MKGIIIVLYIFFFVFLDRRRENALQTMKMPLFFMYCLTTLYHIHRLQTFERNESVITNGKERWKVKRPWPILKCSRI